MDPDLLDPRSHSFIGPPPPSARAEPQQASEGKLHKLLGSRRPQNSADDDDGHVYSAPKREETSNVAAALADLG